MGGVRANLSELAEARVRGDSITRARNAEEVPLATAVGLIARERLTGAPRRPALEKILSDGHINILFVGRIVPNKRIEDHIRLAEVYKRYVDSYYRFIFVGRTDGLPRYYAQVRALIDECLATGAGSSRRSIVIDSPGADIDVRIRR